MYSTGPLLIPRQNVNIPTLTEPTDLVQDFAQWDNVFVFKNARQLLRTAAIVEPSGGVTLRPYDVTRSAYDSDFHSEITPHPMRFWHVSKLIERQVKGEPGALLTNGLANIFPLGRFTLFAFWYEVQAGPNRQGMWWGVDAAPKNGLFWFRGSRFFARI